MQGRMPRLFLLLRLLLGVLLGVLLYSTTDPNRRCLYENQGHGKPAIGSLIITKSQPRGEQPLCSHNNYPNPASDDCVSVLTDDGLSLMAKDNFQEARTKASLGGKEEVIRESLRWRPSSQLFRRQNLHSSTTAALAAAPKYSTTLNTPSSLTNSGADTLMTHAEKYAVTDVSGPGTGVLRRPQPKIDQVVAVNIESEDPGDELKRRFAQYKSRHQGEEVIECAGIAEGKDYQRTTFGDSRKRQTSIVPKATNIIPTMAPGEVITSTFGMRSPRQQHRPPVSFSADSSLEDMARAVSMLSSLQQEEQQPQQPQQHC